MSHPLTSIREQLAAGRLVPLIDLLDYDRIRVRLSEDGLEVWPVTPLDVEYMPMVVGWRNAEGGTPMTDPATPTDADDEIPDDEGQPEAGNGVKLPEETGVGEAPTEGTIDDEREGAPG